MATVKETSGCIFQWKIVNISHWRLRKGYRIKSPNFTADALEGTKWKLNLFPSVDDNEDYVSVYLKRRCKYCSGPDVIEVSYQLAFLDKKGAFLKEVTALSPFERGCSRGESKYEFRKKVFDAERQSFLPEDTLTVQCTMWINEKKLVKPEYLYAQTVLEVNRRSFMWKIDEFSTLKSSLKKKFDDRLIKIRLVLNESEDFKKQLDVNIDSIENAVKYFSFKASIIDSEGEKVNCGTHEHFAGNMKKDPMCTLLIQKWMDNKRRFLPNDVLSLDCELVYSTGEISYELYGPGEICTELKHEDHKELMILKKKCQITKAMAKDLESMYNDRIFSDTELRTTTQTFPAHMNILSARSAVFRRMFSDDMKEKNCGHVDITDLEDDTVHRMLLYMYTGNLDDLQYENACKLYAAADKYEIISLMTSCSSFLKDNLCSSKACDILVLADQHQDVDLKNAVQNFIMLHKEIFVSKEWNDFMASNGKLASDVMYLFALSKINDA